MVVVVVVLFIIGWRGVLVGSKIAREEADGFVVEVTVFVIVFAIEAGFGPETRAGLWVLALSLFLFEFATSNDEVSFSSMAFLP